MRVALAGPADAAFFAGCDVCAPDGKHIARMTATQATRAAPLLTPSCRLAFLPQPSNHHAASHFCYRGPSRVQSRPMLCLLLRSIDRRHMGNRSRNKAALLVLGCERA